MQHLRFLLFLPPVRKKNEDGPGSTSRVLRYEVSGNFTGAVFASYTTTLGGTDNEQITLLPWSKEITYAANVTTAIIAIFGNGGIASQKVTVVVKRAGSQLSSTTATANNSGSFTQAGPVVVF